MSNAGKALVVRTSVHHGNTARVAETIAGVLGADCVSPEACPYERLDGVEILGLGSGVYYGRIHEDLRRWVLGLPKTAARQLQAFIFTTSGLPIFAHLWHWPLKKALAERGTKLIGEFSCRGFDTWGPLWLTGGLNRAHPDDRDLRRAAEFARTMRCLQALFAVTVLLVGATCASEPATDDRAASIGVWDVVAVEINGRHVDDELVSLLQVAYRHDGSWTVFLKGIPVGEGRSRNDQNANPKTFEMETLGGVNAPPRRYTGIYEVHADTRRICFVTAGMPRPETFTTDRGNGRVLVTLRKPHGRILPSRGSTVRGGFATRRGLGLRRFVRRRRLTKSVGCGCCRKCGESVSFPGRER